MRHILPFNTFKLLQTILIPSKQFIKNEILALTIVGLIILAIWINGPGLLFNNVLALQSIEKRIELSLAVILLWILKLIFIHPQKTFIRVFQPLKINDKIRAIEKRFLGALQFLKINYVKKSNQSISLSSLPWYLMMGIGHAGKTSLLANAEISYLLQKQFTKDTITKLPPSEDCDWWVTRDACLIDIPSYYLSPVEQANKSLRYEPDCFRLLQSLIQRHCYPNQIRGIILTISFLDLINIKKNGLHSKLQYIYKRLHETKLLFKTYIPCHLIITQCDKMSGFIPFFSDICQDEQQHSFGINLHQSKDINNYLTHYEHEFNIVIQKINQQLLFRLHQERDPLLRPEIKDFPLQLEKLKHAIHFLLQNFLKETPFLNIEKILLTSALQSPQIKQSSPIVQNKKQELEIAGKLCHELQLLQSESYRSKPYFIKQYLQEGLARTSIKIEKKSPPFIKQKLTLAASLMIVGIAGILLFKDFQDSIKITQNTQYKFNQYFAVIKRFQNPEEHLIETVNLLNDLSYKARSHRSVFNPMQIFSYYTHQTQKKSELLYQETGNKLLLIEMNHYLTDYLLNPSNHSTHSLYQALQLYLILTQQTQDPSNYINKLLPSILSSRFTPQLASILNKQLIIATQQKKYIIPADNKLINDTRLIFQKMPTNQLSTIILKNKLHLLNNNNLTIFTDLSKKNNPFDQSQVETIPSFYTGIHFKSIYLNTIPEVAHEAIQGNWVIGSIAQQHSTKMLHQKLTQQLQQDYLTNYINKWEKLITSLRIIMPSDLEKTNALLARLRSEQSPLISFLQLIYQQTYFEPIASNSTILKYLGALLDKNADAGKLNDIFYALYRMEQYLNPVLQHKQENKAAFNLLKQRMDNINHPNPLTNLYTIAANSPKPIQNWLEILANHIWKNLMNKASIYLDTSWNNEVYRPYQHYIANHYPFSNDHHNFEVDIKAFAAFFGNPGILYNFYYTNLSSFIDQSHENWQWKTIDGKTLPFSEVTLRHIQHALKIHHAFFPNNDANPSLEFTLKPYEFSQRINKVWLGVNNNLFTDTNTNNNVVHKIKWPNNSWQQETFLSFTLDNNRSIVERFSGSWGWFKLLNDSIESIKNKNQLYIKLSMKNHSAKYILSINGNNNPFLSLNLRHFSLQPKLSYDRQETELTSI